MTEPIRPVSVLTVPSSTRTGSGPLSELRHWPRRRWVTFAIGVIALSVLFSPALAGQPKAPAWAWAASFLLAVPGAMIIASYVPVPGSGRRIDLGCTPCAIVAAGAVLMALLFRAGAPADPGRTALCLAMLGVGLYQRLVDPARCPSGPSGVEESAGPPRPQEDTPA